MTIRFLDLGFKEEEINHYLDQVIRIGETDINKITRTMLGFLMKTGNISKVEKNKPKKSKIILKDENDIRYITKKAKKKKNQFMKD